MSYPGIYYAGAKACVLRLTKAIQLLLDQFPNNEQVIIHYDISFVNLCHFVFIKNSHSSFSTGPQTSFSIAKASAIDISSFFL